MCHGYFYQSIDDVRLCNLHGGEVVADKEHVDEDQTHGGGGRDGLCGSNYGI